MLKNLYLFDVSPFIHAGNVNKFAKLEKLVDMGTTWKTLVTPCGGISLIFNTLYSILGKGDIVFCCDRNPTIKKDMLSTYKHNRDHARPIEVGKAIAEYILADCGCTVLARAGYEADDIIYSIVQRDHDAYDNIYIYTGDSDLYFLVDDKVSILPSSSRAKEVTIQNYAEVLSKYGARYNTMTMMKILGGDSSDCIPGLPTNVVKQMASTFYQPPMEPKLGNKEFVLKWFDYLYPEYKYQAELVFPLDVEDLPTSFSTPDRQSIVNWGSAMNNKFFRGMGSPDFPIKEHLEEIHKYGMYLEDVN